MAGWAPRPVWGRPSPAAQAPWPLRGAATADAAAVRADGGDGAWWALRAASLSGTRHRLAGAGPEDAYGWAQAGELLVVAVADGVGSRPRAAAASNAAVAAALDAAVAALETAGAVPGRPATDAAAGPALDAGSPLGAVGPALDAAVREANEAAGRSGGGATTLVVAVLDPSGGARLRRVGDSSAFVLSGGEWRELWAGPGDDGTVQTATTALPAEQPPAQAAAASLGPGDVLLLATDGVADPLRDGPTTVAPGMAAALAAPPEPLELARVVDFSRQGVHDDRTVVVLWPAGTDP